MKIRKNKKNYKYKNNKSIIKIFQLLKNQNLIQF